MVLMGKLNIAPTQAHFILRLLVTLCRTPIILTMTIIKVTTFVSKGLNPVKACYLSWSKNKLKSRN